MYDKGEGKRKMKLHRVLIICAIALMAAVLATGCVYTLTPEAEMPAEAEAEAPAAADWAAPEGALVAPMVDEVPTLDGVADDAAWADAVAISIDVEDGANMGEKATLATQRELLALREAGRSQTRLIGASMRDGAQVGTLAGLDVFTMPPKVATGYRANPLPSVVSMISQDPHVTTKQGVELDDFAARTLWDVTPEFRSCATEIAEMDTETLSPDAIIDRLAQAGFGDLFPGWSEQDVHTAVTDGKIPCYDHWKARLAAAGIGLDALMNLSAFHSFATDQAALDARITSYIG
jgi:hypothetical protein